MAIPSILLTFESPIPDSPLVPETRVVVIGQAGDLPRALTHPAVEAGRFVVVEAHALDVEVELADRARSGCFSWPGIAGRRWRWP